MKSLETFEEGIDAHIAGAPRAAQGKLSQILVIFKEVVPPAEEMISYHMLYYHYRDKDALGGFMGYDDHVSIFGALPEKLIDEEEREYKARSGRDRCCCCCCCG
jgi:uncharacterized protein YdhG (YjbR/CyaY superfamily)